MPEAAAYVIVGQSEHYQAVVEITPSLAVPAAWSYWIGLYDKAEGGFIRDDSIEPRVESLAVVREHGRLVAESMLRDAEWRRIYFPFRFISRFSDLAASGHWPAVYHLVRNDTRDEENYLTSCSFWITRTNATSAPVATPAGVICPACRERAALEGYALPDDVHA